MSTYRVTAGYVTVETAVPGGRAAIDIPRGSLLPDDVPAEDIARLVNQGHIARQPSEPRAAEPAALVPDGTADEVLAWVGDDSERAGDAMVAEVARRGDKQRVTLLRQLARIQSQSVEPRVLDFGQ